MLKDLKNIFIWKKVVKSSVEDLDYVRFIRITDPSHLEMNFFSNNFYLNLTEAKLVDFIEVNRVLTLTQMCLSCLIYL